MRKTSNQSGSLFNPASGWNSTFINHTKILTGILGITLLHFSPQASGAILPPPSGYNVNLAWDNNSDVAGYRVYYGAASGNYSTNINVGNVATTTLSNLAGGIAYFFAVTSYDWTGMESVFSEEISFVPGTPTVRFNRNGAGQMVLTVRGTIGHTYQIQAAENLATWTTIATVTLSSTDSLQFIDVNAMNFPIRFYRTRDTQF